MLLCLCLAGNGENSWSQADTDVDRQSGIYRQSHHNPASEIYTDLLKLDTELPRDTCTSLKRLLGLGMTPEIFSNVHLSLYLDLEAGVWTVVSSNHKLLLLRTIIAINFTR